MLIVAVGILSFLKSVTISIHPQVITPRLHHKIVYYCPVHPPLSTTWMYGSIKWGTTLELGGIKVLQPAKERKMLVLLCYLTFIITKGWSTDLCNQAISQNNSHSKLPVTIITEFVQSKQAVKINNPFIWKQNPTTNNWKSNKERKRRNTLLL